MPHRTRARPAGHGAAGGSRATPGCPRLPARVARRRGSCAASASRSGRPVRAARSPMAPWSRWDSPRKSSHICVAPLGRQPTGRCGRWSPRADCGSPDAGGSWCRRVRVPAGLRPRDRPLATSPGCSSRSSGPVLPRASRTARRFAESSTDHVAASPRPFFAARPSFSNFNRWANTERPASSCTSGG